MRHKISLPRPNVVSLPPDCSHTHTTAIANTSEAYRLITAPEQCWTDRTEHPEHRHCQKSVRINGCLITIRAPEIRS
jgi:hypothetical protein